MYISYSISFLSFLESPKVGCPCNSYEEVFTGLKITCINKNTFFLNSKAAVGYILGGLIPIFSFVGVS